MSAADRCVSPPAAITGVPIVLNFWGGVHGRDCDGTSRRDFLRVGALGLSGFSLSNLLRRQAAASERGVSKKDTSVVWIWLGGGPSHIETFDPKMEAPVEFRSCVGS